MIVHALGISGFRNLAETIVEPAAGLNVFTGDNGQGKTNLLESIYLLGTLRSFRTTHAAELIRHDAESAQLRARVSTDGMERHYELELTARKRTLALDGKTPRSLADYFGSFNVVLFAPEDLRVPRDAPAGRRRFLDRTVFTRRASFLGDAQRYARVLKSRNAVLRAERVDMAQLEVYDEQLAVAGARVVMARREVLAELAPRFGAAFASITATGLAAEVVYASEFATVPDEELPVRLRAAQVAQRPRDLARRATSAGPHVDDLEFMLGGREARAFASQGQLRALVLAWKIAEIQLIAEVTGSAPLLLLDDVSSELDRTRNRQLFAFLDEIACQCFVTTTDGNHVATSNNRKDFQVVEGRISAT